MDVQLGDGRVPAFSLLVFVVTVSCFQTVAVYLCSFCVRSWGFCTCVQCLLRLCRNVVFVRSIYVHGVSFFKIQLQLFLHHHRSYWACSRRVCIYLSWCFTISAVAVINMLWVILCPSVFFVVISLVHCHCPRSRGDLHT